MLLVCKHSKKCSSFSYSPWKSLGFRMLLTSYNPGWQKRKKHVRYLVWEKESKANRKFIGFCSHRFILQHFWMCLGFKQISTCKLKFHWIHRVVFFKRAFRSLKLLICIHGKFEPTLACGLQTLGWTWAYILEPDSRAAALWKLA